MKRDEQDMQHYFTAEPLSESRPTLICAKSRSSNCEAQSANKYLSVGK